MLFHPQLTIYVYNIHQPYSPDTGEKYGTWLGIKEKMKNILIILTDQQRKDSLGCYGNYVCNTPNLNRLAANGMRFERNYVANPICMPNRLSLFTGKNIRNHSLWTNGLVIPPCRTIADHFQENGYQTASIGKMHFTPIGGNSGNMESRHFWINRESREEWNGPYWGFEHVEFTLGHTHVLAHYGKWFYDHGGTDDMLKLYSVSHAMQSGVRELPEELHDSAFIADRTIQYLKNERNPDKPFFLVASFPDPHHPFNPPVRTAGEYSTKDIIEPAGTSNDLEIRPEHYLQHFRGEWHRSGKRPAEHPDGISLEHTQELIRHTYAMVDLIDRNIGKIVGTIDEMNLRNDTIIVFTSDHGELLGDHGLWFKGPFFYEGLLNTPLIISCPSMIDQGVSDKLFSDIDLVPTLCDLAEVSPMPYADGISQMPHILDRNHAARDRCLIEYRNGYGKNDCSCKALVTKQYKYVRYQTGEEELTDLLKDPEERRNVAGDAGYQEIKGRLRNELLDEVLKTEQRGPEQISHA